jgi:Tfp pilus assembly protein PilV
MSIKSGSRQSGFAVIEAVLIAIILGIIGFVGWYVMNSNNKTQQQLNSAVKESSATAAKSSKSSKSSSATKSTMFVFKEFGVQITLPDSLKDLSYTAKQVDMGDGTTATSLFLNYPSLATAIDACNTTKGSTGNFAAIGKGSGQFPADPTPDIGGLLKQFSGFYISTSYPNGIPCGDDSKEASVVAAMQSLQKSLVEAFKTAALVQ